LSRWSLGEIVKSLLAAQRVSAISRSTVWRWLRAEKLKPWRFHHRQPILDPQKFLERARPVLEAYEKAVESLRNGIWVVCVDEKDLDPSPPVGASTSTCQARASHLCCFTL
jgi:hypothetical protein